MFLGDLSNEEPAENSSTESLVFLNAFTRGWLVPKGNVIHETIATTIFSATQRCNIVATLLRMQRYVALKIVVANRPV